MQLIRPWEFLAPPLPQGGIKKFWFKCVFLLTQTVDKTWSLHFCYPASKHLFSNLITYDTYVNVYKCLLLVGGCYKKTPLQRARPPISINATPQILGRYCHLYYHIIILSVVFYTIRKPSIKSYSKSHSWVVGG